MGLSGYIELCVLQMFHEKKTDMATVAWVIMKHHKKADGTYNPKIRITHKRTTGYIPTQIFTRLVRFKRGEASGSTTDECLEDSLNDKVKDIRKLLNRYEEIIEDCENAKEVIAFIGKKSNESRDLDFLIFSQKYHEGMKDNGSKLIVGGLISNLWNFVGSKGLPVKHLTSRFLVDFENWLRTDRILIKGGKERICKPVADKTILTYMQLFQAIFNKMLLVYNNYDIGDIVIAKNPFKNYRPTFDIPNKKKAVSATIIRAIAAYAPEVIPGNENRIFARDMFILSFCLAGMNLADIFTCSHYSDNRIEYRRAKTKDKKRDGAFISIPVVSEIGMLVEKYLDPDGVRVFDLHKRYSAKAAAQRSIVRGMKAMCKDLGIEPITFYAARHSFATIARNDCNVSMEDVALCLTHRSGFNMTDTYVKPDFSRVDRVIRKVMDFVFGKKGLP